MLLGNLLLALAWAALQGDFSLQTLLTGQILGYLILVALVRGGVLSTSPYVGRIHRVVGLIAYFLWELIKANLRLALEARDVRRRLAAVRGRVAAADGRLKAAAVRNRDRADARFRVLVGRLENLSPLAVLARGYAVCWNTDRTAVIHTASQVAAGERVRVTLHEGELHCDVTRIERERLRPERGA